MPHWICPKCGALCPRGRPCERCAEGQLQPPSGRPYKHRWRKLSELKRKRHPICEVCKWHFATTAADDVHHICPVAVNPALEFVWSNLLSVCSGHHRQLESEIRAKGWEFVRDRLEKEKQQWLSCQA